MKPVKVFMLILILSVLLTACGSMPTPPADDPSTLATMVAATVQAALNEPPAEAPADLPAAPTQTSPAENGNAPAPAAPTATPIPTSTVPPPPPAAGLKVAYVKDGNVYVWTEGGSSIGLTSTGDARRVRISSDGQRIAYVRELAGAPFAYELWVVNSDGWLLNPQLLVSQAEMGVLKAASQFASADGFDFDQVEFRPGTHDLYYSTVPRFMGPGYAPSYDLRMVNADTQAKSALFDFGQAGAFTFSPDGAQVVLSTPDHISLANADGNNLRSHVLTYPLVGTYSEYQYHPFPIWAADSLSLRVAIPPEDTLAEPTPPTSLWYIPVDGTSATQLGSMNSIPFDWPNNAFSPDMSYIAYVKSVGDPTANQRELHIAYADGSGDIVFATGTSLQFRGWTPDSTRFLYASNSVDDSGLYLGSIGGGVFTISSVHQTMRQIEWVDNDRIIFIYENPTTNASELRISHQGGTNHAFIDTLTDSFPSYDFTQ
jgi:Tol biopolymer transport system component